MLGKHLRLVKLTRYVAGIQANVAVKICSDIFIVLQ